MLACAYQSHHYTKEGMLRPITTLDYRCACPKITRWTTGKCMGMKINQQTNVSFRRPITTCIAEDMPIAQALRQQVKRRQKIGHQVKNLVCAVKSRPKTTVTDAQTIQNFFRQCIYLLRESQPQSTQRVAIASFWRTFHHDGKN